MKTSKKTKKPRLLHIVTLVSAPYIEAMAQYHKLEKEDRMGRRIQKHDPHRGTEMREAAREKLLATKQERIAKLLAGKRLGGIFATRKKATQAIFKAGTCPSEAGYFPLLVIETIPEGCITGFLTGNPIWMKLGRKGYNPCNTPTWAKNLEGFCC
jgi:hypothetical protein